MSFIYKSHTNNGLSSYNSYEGSYDNLIINGTPPVTIADQWMKAYEVNPEVVFIGGYIQWTAPGTAVTEVTVDLDIPTDLIPAWWELQQNDGVVGSLDFAGFFDTPSTYNAGTSVILKEGSVYKLKCTTETPTNLVVLLFRSNYFKIL